MTYNVQSRYDLQGSRMQAINPDPLGTVTIRNPRTQQQVSGIVACLGNTNTIEMMPGVAQTQIRYQDFIINSADLDFGTGAVRPKNGWHIERQDGSTYKVVALGGSDAAPFEYITASNKRMRIHTELIHRH